MFRSVFHSIGTCVAALESSLLAMKRVSSVLLLTFAIGALFTIANVGASSSNTARRITESYSFNDYVRDFKKPWKHGSAEHGMRSVNFKMALARVLAHNANPLRTYDKAINRFSDWTEEEMRGIRGARYTPGFHSRREVPFVPPQGLTIAPEVDYRKASPAVLTAVKDQGMCGDCWAHATTEAIESAFARKTGQLFVLSQQQVTSCTPMHYTCYSCNGSYPRLAYDYVATAEYGLVEEWVYPFASWTADFPVCNSTLTKPVIQGLDTTVSIFGYTQVAPNSESDIVAALNTLGPLSVLVDADSWSDYGTGVFTGCAFGPNFGLDHAVLLVGYGHDSATDLDYWIVRNSWSAGWGEGGYIRIARHVGGPNATQCGITSGLSCQSNYTANISSCGPCGLWTDAQFPLVNATSAYEDL